MFTHTSHPSSTLTLRYLNMYNMHATSTDSLAVYTHITPSLHPDIMLSQHVQYNMHATSIDTHSTDTHPQHHSCLSTSNPSLPALRATNMHSTSVVHLPNLGTTHPSLSTPGAYFTSPPYTTFFNTFGHPSHAIYPRQKMLLWKFYRMAWTAHANADAPAP